jgi:hypothetical protein
MWNREGYNIYVSTRKGKKYDVYKDNKYVCSFGARDMEHYKDRLGYYSHLDHNDPVRRQAFKNRFRRLISRNDKSSGIYWADKYLW